MCNFDLHPIFSRFVHALSTLSIYGELGSDYRTRVLLDASERSVRRQGATSIFNSKSEQLELTISEE